MSQYAKWSAPLKWAPLIFVLTLKLNLTDFISISGPYLIVPIGAHLALRYGRAGCIVLYLASLPLLLNVSISGFGSRSDIGLYLSALVISRWLQTRGSRSHELPRLRLRPLIYVAFLILPLRIGLGYGDLLWFEDVRWVVDLYALFFVLLFALGASRVAVRPILVGLTAVVIFGLLLEYLSLPKNAAEWIQADRAELPGFGLTNLRSLFLAYHFDTPAELLTAFGFFFFGRFLADLNHRNKLSLPSQHWRYGLTVAVILLALGGQLNVYLLPKAHPALTWMGSFYAIFLAGMIAGLFFQFAGILGTLILVTGFWWIDGVVRSDLDIIQPHFYYTIDYLLYAYGFGLIGLRIRNEISGPPTRFWNAVWFRHLAIYLLFLISAISPFDSPYGVFLFALAFFAGIAGALGFNRLMAYLPKNPEVVLKGRWIPFVSLCLLGYLLYSLYQGSWHLVSDAFNQSIDLVKQLWVAKKALDEEELIMGVWGFWLAAGSLLIGLWLMTSTLRELSQSLRQLLVDLREIAEHSRNKKPFILRFRRQDKKTPTPGEKKPAKSIWHETLNWTNRVLLLAIILIPIALSGYNLVIQHQEEMARERRHRDWTPSEDTLARRQKYEKARADLIAVLTRSSQSVLKDYPDVNTDQGSFETTLSSGWYQKTSEPEIRRRAAITIRPTIRFQKMPPDKAFRRSVRVSLHRQDKGRFGLWVEHIISPDREGERILENEIEDAIVLSALAELE
jgi:hypothetical protein